RPATPAPSTMVEGLVGSMASGSSVVDDQGTGQLRESLRALLGDKNGFAQRCSLGGGIHVEDHLRLETPAGTRMEDASEVAGPRAGARIEAEGIAADVVEGRTQAQGEQTAAQDRVHV